MDNISERSFIKSTENVCDTEENSSTTGISGIVNNGTTIDSDDVNLRNGINEFHQSEVIHISSYHPIRTISLTFSFYLIDLGYNKN